MKMNIIIRNIIYIYIYPFKICYSATFGGKIDIILNFTFEEIWEIQQQ